MLNICTMVISHGQAGDLETKVQFQSKGDLLLFGPALTCKVQQQHFKVTHPCPAAEWSALLQGPQW